ncbi:hypothetical protein C4552_04860 [Candidatus Parcubacteria bacterium]|nr:MAG: hypothetical protein C4552_04860 [Candidatus Parcubacteria bacterium]
MKKLEILRQIEECLRESPVAESFSSDWRARLIEPHREHPLRSPQILTIIAVCFGYKEGWITLRQAGNGFMVGMYAPELLRGSDAARNETNTIKKCLDKILPAHLVQIRAATPPQELLRKLEQAA